MNQQVIIAIGREFGSGGHVIAEELSKRFHLPLYDQNLLEQVAEEKGVDHATLEKYDEKPILKFFTKTVKGYSSSLAEHVANMQYKFLQDKADAGDSFVIVGRCAERKLAENKHLISIFVLGDIPCKIKRVKEVYGLATDEEADRMRMRKDLERKMYHNNHSRGKWGDSRNYHLSVNSSKLGIEKTIDFLEVYIKERIKEFEA